MRQIPICQTAIERHRAAQGRNVHTYLAHDLAARPAGKFQFSYLLSYQLISETHIQVLLQGLNVGFRFRPGTAIQPVPRRSDSGSRGERKTGQMICRRYFRY